MEAKTTISAPWVSYYKKLYALFEYDEEVAMSYSDDERKVTILVESQIKADALAELLPNEKTFGNVTLKIEVVPSNSEVDRLTLFRHAFSGNPIVSSIETSDGGAFALSYVMFSPDAVQFYDDNMGDPNGMCTMLPQDLASEVFEEHDGVFFSTELIDSIML